MYGHRPVTTTLLSSLAIQILCLWIGKDFYWSKTSCAYIILHFRVQIFQCSPCHIIFIQINRIGTERLYTRLYKYSYFLMPEAKLSILFSEYYLLILFLIFLGNHFNTQTMTPLSTQENVDAIEKNIERNIAKPMPSGKNTK